MHNYVHGSMKLLTAHVSTGHRLPHSRPPSSYRWIYTINRAYMGGKGGVKGVSVGKRGGHVGNWVAKWARVNTWARVTWVRVTWARVGRARVT